MQILGLTKTTLLDYPGRVAAVLFTGGCCFRCPFCHNGELVLSPSSLPALSEEELFSFLQKRRGVLTGLCVSGGEPTLQPDLPAFLDRVKSRFDYAIKLDTNGQDPALLRQLVRDGLVDSIAMDIKAGPDHYARACGIPDVSLEPIRASAAFLMEGTLPFEFRTTVVRELHTDQDFLQIGQWIAGAPAYFLQSYTDSAQVLSPGLHACSKEQLTHFLSLVRRTVPSAALRGVD